MQRFLFNWKLKVTALVLSLALWSHVRGEVNPWETATFRVPLKWTAPTRTIALNRDKIPAVVRVNLRAPRSRLRELKGFAPANPLSPAAETLISNGDVTATLDFALARRGEQDVPIKGESHFDDVEIIGVKPSDVIVQLDRAETRSFPIQAQDFPSRGYRIENIQLENDSAVVSGLSNALEKVARVRARVRSGALKLNQRQRIAGPLEAIDAQGQIVPNVRVEAQSVGVSAVLREQIIERPFAGSGACKRRGRIATIATSSAKSSGARPTIANRKNYHAVLRCFLQRIGKPKQRAPPRDSTRARRGRGKRFCHAASTCSAGCAHHDAAGNANGHNFPQRFGHTNCQ